MFRLFIEKDFESKGKKKKERQKEINLSINWEYLAIFFFISYIFIDASG